MPSQAGSLVATASRDGTARPWRCKGSNFVTYKDYRYLQIQRPKKIKKVNNTVPTI